MFGGNFNENLHEALSAFAIPKGINPWGKFVLCFFLIISLDLSLCTCTLMKKSRYCNGVFGFFL